MFFLWINRHIDEINESRPLRIYGGFLSFIFVLQSLYWWKYGFGEKLSIDVEAICWPFFRDCSGHRFLSTDGNHVLFFLMGMLGVVNALAFFYKKIKYGFWGLIFLELLSLWVILLDYRTRLNQNIMILFVLFTFLFVSSKERTLPWIVASFYFWAGFLKLRPEWVSGEAIPGSLWLVPDQFKSYAAIYVIVLELFLIWGLLSKKVWMRNVVLVQLFFFHLASLGVVGFYYPLLMALLLSFFVLKKDTTKPMSQSGMAILLILSLLNFFPLFIAGDSAVTGEFRILSFHMFDSRTICEPTAFIKKEGMQLIRKDLQIPAVIRLRCDPVVFLSRARTLCRNFKNDPHFIDLDLSLKTRRINEESLQTVVDVKNFCSVDPSYSVLGFNPWIHK